MLTLEDYVEIKSNYLKAIRMAFFEKPLVELYKEKGIFDEHRELMDRLYKGYHYQDIEDFNFWNNIMKTYYIYIPK